MPLLSAMQSLNGHVKQFPQWLQLYGVIICLSHLPAYELGVIDCEIILPISNDCESLINCNHSMPFRTRLPCLARIYNHQSITNTETCPICCYHFPCYHLSSLTAAPEGSTCVIILVIPETSLDVQWYHSPLLIMAFNSLFLRLISSSS